MLKGQTLIVVGAGASAELGLPTGHDLKKNIAKLLDIRFDDWGRSMVSGDSTIFEALRSYAHHAGEPNVNPYVHAARRIRDAMPQAISIDNFIDSHHDDTRLTLCGKLGIVRGILNAERKSALHVDMRTDKRHPNFSTFSDTWFEPIMQLLTQSCQLSGIEDRLSRLTFIIFNYDRCVEQFLYHGLQNYYGIDEAAAAALLRNLKIYHPYGAVGSLPWQSGAHRIEFGDDPSVGTLLQLAKEIRTFTEGTDPGASDIKELRAKVRDADVALFLGFAYHSMNLALLQAESPHRAPNRAKYFGTTFGMSQSDTDLVKEDLLSVASVMPGNIVLRNDLKCAGFIREHWRSLSIA
jgi:hypothetical protein